MIGLLALGLLATTGSPVAAQAPDVVFVGTPAEVVVGMLGLAGVADTDVVYDLGSGDGRIVIAAARQYGARAVGIEIDSILVEESRRSADSAGVAARTEFRRGDLFAAPLREATVVTLYLGRHLNERLRPTLLRDLRPGGRVVSQNFDMGDWSPDSVVRVGGRSVGETSVHLWIIPADMAGAWTFSIDGATGSTRSRRVELVQRFQMLSGGPSVQGRLRGHAVTLRLDDGTRLEGRVRGDAAEGTVVGGPAAGRRWKATRPPRPEARRPSIDR